MFKRIRKLAEQTETLVGRDWHKVGSFRCRVDDGLLYFNRPPAESQLVYAPGTARHEGQLQQLVVTVGGIRWVVRAALLTRNDQRTTFPRLTCDWESRGRLNQLQIEVAAGSRAIYVPNGGAWKSRKMGVAEALADLPKVLNGLEAIGDETIPWEINYPELAQKVLDDSGLADFVQAIAPQR